MASPRPGPVHTRNPAKKQSACRNEMRRQQRARQRYERHALRAHSCVYMDLTTDETGNDLFDERVYAKTCADQVDDMADMMLEDDVKALGDMFSTDLLRAWTPYDLERLSHELGINTTNAKVVDDDYARQNNDVNVDVDTPVDREDQIAAQA